MERLITLLILITVVVISGCIGQTGLENVGMKPTTTISTTPTTCSQGFEISPAGNCEPVLAKVGKIQASLEGNIITVYLDQLSSTNKGSPLNQIIWDWGDCTNTRVTSNTEVSHTYKMFKYGGTGCDSAIFQNAHVSSSTIFYYVVYATVYYADGTQFSRNYNIQLPS